MMLEKHNEYRKTHQAPPLAIDENTAKEAQLWSKEMSDTNKFEHAPKDTLGGCGESLAGSSDTTAMQSTTKAVDMWYEEIKDYDFSNPGFDPTTGHFT